AKANVLIKLLFIINLLKTQIANESINIKEQERLIRIEYKKLVIQKDKNDELKKEIILREKLQKLLYNCTL
ncbi:4708_t:CDS:1, partial [Ambispora leptoticha]